jgi:hypothetical protein
MGHSLVDTGPASGGTAIGTCTNPPEETCCSIPLPLGRCIVFSFHRVIWITILFGIFSGLLFCGLLPQGKDLPTGVDPHWWYPFLNKSGFGDQAAPRYYLNQEEIRREEALAWLGDVHPGQDTFRWVVVFGSEEYQSACRTVVDQVWDSAPALKDKTLLVTCKADSPLLEGRNYDTRQGNGIYVLLADGKRIDSQFGTVPNLKWLYLALTSSPPVPSPTPTPSPSPSPTPPPSPSPTPTPTPTPTPLPWPWSLLSWEDWILLLCWFALVGIYFSYVLPTNPKNQQPAQEKVSS